MNVQYAIKNDEIYVIEVNQGQVERFHLFRKRKIYTC